VPRYHFALVDFENHDEDPVFLDRRQITLLEKAGCFAIVFLMTSFTDASHEPDKAYLRERRRCDTALPDL
jgi:hypothetical protein